MPLINLLKAILQVPAMVLGGILQWVGHFSPHKSKELAWQFIIIVFGVFLTFQFDSCLVRQIELAKQSKAISHAQAELAQTLPELLYELELLEELQKYVRQSQDYWFKGVQDKMDLGVSNLFYRHQEFPYFDRRRIASLEALEAEQRSQLSLGTRSNLQLFNDGLRNLTELKEKYHVWSSEWIKHWSPSQVDTKHGVTWTSCCPGRVRELVFEASQLFNLLEDQTIECLVYGESLAVGFDDIASEKVNTLTDSLNQWGSMEKKINYFRSYGYGFPKVIYLATFNEAKSNSTIDSASWPNWRDSSFVRATHQNTFEWQLTNLYRRGLWFSEEFNVSAKGEWNLNDFSILTRCRENKKELVLETKILGLNLVPLVYRTRFRKPLSLKLLGLKPAVLVYSSLERYGLTVSSSSHNLIANDTTSWVDHFSAKSVQPAGQGLHFREGKIKIYNTVHLDFSENLPRTIPDVWLPLEEQPLDIQIDLSGLKPLKLPLKNDSMIRERNTEKEMGTIVDAE